MALRQAKVFFKDQEAGQLSETATEGTRFSYNPEWKEPIACCFPITKREYEWERGLHPFFAHLCPEGWLRGQQAKSAHISEEDDFGLLLKYGQDCIGAIGIQPNIRDDISLDSENIFTNPGHTISGIQKKLLVKKMGKATFEPAGIQELAPYIAKFNAPHIDTLVRNEALSLHWASLVLGPTEVTSFSLGSLPQLNEVALIITRFDRSTEGAKLRLEDCAQSA